MQIGYSKYRSEKRKHSLSGMTKKVSDVYDVICYEMGQRELPKALVLIIALTLVASVQNLVIGLLVIGLAYIIYQKL